MKLIDAVPILKSSCNIKFRDLYTPQELENIIIAKGNTGKLLEKILGLPAGNTLRDFEDGELKTNKVDALGKPMETMFITQISTRIDELLNHHPFEESWLRKKIDKILYVPVIKTSANPLDWYFGGHSYIEINIGSPLYNQLANDYEVICLKMIHDIENMDGNIHTSSGKYIQIRTKDAKPYNPIYSNKYGKYISNKNFAFYFMKEFMIDIPKFKIT